MKPKNKGGRKRVINEKKRKTFLNSLRQGLTIQDALFVSGIKTPTFYREKDRNEEFREEVESASRFVQVVARTNIATQIIKNKDIGLSKWWLEKKDSDFKESPLIQQNLNSIQLSENQLNSMLKNIEEGIIIENEYLQQKNE